MKKLNIGCGRDYREGWVNIDISKHVKTDHLVDIQTEPLPFYDNFFDEVYCSGVLEQILKNDDLVHVMNEMYRVLKSEGVATIVVPSARYSNAFRDPHDCRQFTEETFNYFVKDHQLYRDYGSVYGYQPWSMYEYITNARGIMTVTLTK